ncbi:MAG TPA: hypothetical protein VFP90_07990 [Gemmatimonadaceae bacterium]|nr:hypothetical protein [Gemmatimonadaceae bacterium]
MVVAERPAEISPSGSAGKEPWTWDLTRGTWDLTRGTWDVCIGSDLRAL